MRFNEIVEKLVEQQVKIEDSVVAQYIKSQADYLVSKGEDLSQYELERVESDMGCTEGGIRVLYSYRLRKSGERGWSHKWSWYAKK